MPRASNAVASRLRRKKILKKAKGYWGARSRLIANARQTVDKAGQYAYRDRRVRKREMRRLWIIRINAACRANGTTYATFMHGLQAKGIDLDRRMLADIAATDPESFAEIVQAVQA